MKGNAFENNVEKGEKPGNQHFFSYDVFYPIRDKSQNMRLSRFVTCSCFDCK